MPLYLLIIVIYLPQMKSLHLLFYFNQNDLLKGVQ